VLAPLGLLSFRLVRELWLVGGLACVLGTVVPVARRLRLPVAPSVLVAFLAFPTVSALEFANVTLLELPIVALIGVAVAAGRWRRVAVLLLVGIALKPVLAPCLLVLVRHRRWRELIGVLLGLLVLDAAVLGVVGDAGGWLRQLRAGLATAGADPASADLGSLADRAHLPRAVVVLMILAVLALAGVVFRRAADPALVVAAPLLVAFLAGPVAWAHYPLLLVPLVMTLVARPGLGGRFLAVAALLLFTAPELVAGHLILTVPAARLFPLITGGMGLLLLAAALAVRPGTASDPVGRPRAGAPTGSDAGGAGLLGAAGLRALAGRAGLHRYDGRRAVDQPEGEALLLLQEPLDQRVVGLRHLAGGRELVGERDAGQLVQDAVRGLGDRRHGLDRCLLHPLQDVDDLVAGLGGDFGVARHGAYSSVGGCIPLEVA